MFLLLSKDWVRVLFLLFPKNGVPEIEVPGMKKPLPETVRKGLFVESVSSMAGSNN